MITVTTHQGAEVVLRPQARPIHAIGGRTLVVLMGAEMILIFGVLVWILFGLMPASTPFASVHDLTPVMETIRGSINGTINDPLIDVMPGMSVRASNLRGLSRDGITYFYYVEGRTNFDPLSRGAIDRQGVEVLLRDTSGPGEIVIYRLR